MNLVKSIQAGAAILLATLGVLCTADASAQECQADADCGPGYVCQVSAGGGCGVGPCSIDGVCPPPVCETVEYRSCTAAPCAADADCPASMACHSESWEECSAPASTPCARDQTCDAAAAPELNCTQGTSSYCSERYNLPCEADADCGPGFECVESVIGSCSGGGAVSTGDGGVSVEPTPVTCTSQPSGEYYCKLLDLPCTADTDCPSGLSCKSGYFTDACIGSVGAVGGGSGGLAGGIVLEPADCGVPTQPHATCVPPHYAGGGGTVGGLSSGSDAGVGSSSGSGSTGGLSAGGGALGGGPGGTSGGVASDAGTDEDEHHHGPRAPHHGWLRPWFGPGGCSVSGAPAPDLAWLAIAGLLFGTARRRRD